MPQVDKADLDNWLIAKSQYIRVRALATGDSIEQTLAKVGDRLREEAAGKFPQIDVTALLRIEVYARLELPSISYVEVVEMCELIYRVRGGGAPPVPPTPPSTPSPAVAGAIPVPIEEDEIPWKRLKVVA